MDALTFPMLFLLLQKNIGTLQQQGLTVQYQNGVNNIFDDAIIIEHKDFLKRLTMKIIHRQWGDTPSYRRFTLQTNESGMFFFQMNSLTGLPIRVYPNEIGSFKDSGALPKELEQFGETILKIFHQYVRQINQDRLDHFLKL